MEKEKFKLRRLDPIPPEFGKQFNRRHHQDSGAKVIPRTKRRHSRKQPDI
jgi:hypothetical protein